MIRRLVVSATLAPGVKARLTADCDTPASRATSCAVACLTRWVLVSLRVPSPGGSSSRVQQDLLPDRGFVQQHKFAPQTPWPEFGMADAHHMDLRARWLSKTAPAVMRAV